MSDDAGVRCRLVACKESEAWRFYLINDGELPFDWVAVDEICYEWGDFGNSEKRQVRLPGLEPGAHIVVWNDDGSGAELRMTFSMRVGSEGRELRLGFEFPKLYHLALPVVEGLGKRGYAAESRGRLA